MNLTTCAESSQTLARRVEEVVTARTGVAIRDLQVNVTREHVVLTGRTTSYYNKQLATHAVLNSIDERTLVNEISVGSH